MISIYLNYEETQEMLKNKCSNDLRPEQWRQLMEVYDGIIIDCHDNGEGVVIIYKVKHNEVKQEYIGQFNYYHGNLGRWIYHNKIIPYVHRNLLESLKND